MIPFHQQHFPVPGVSEGDCLRACIASLTETPIGLVPHFVLFPSWLKALNLWLAPRGLRYVQTPEVPPDGELVVLLGHSPRGFYHAVIARCADGKDVSDWEIVHDPHPLGGGLVDRDIYYRLAKIEGAHVQL